MEEKELLEIIRLEDLNVKMISITFLIGSVGRTFFGLCLSILYILKNLKSISFKIDYIIFIKGNYIFLY